MAPDVCRALELIRENFAIPEEAFKMASSMLSSWDYDVIALEVHSTPFGMIACGGLLGCDP